MNFENIGSILRTAFMLQPLAKSEPLESQLGIILYSINSAQRPSVILKRSAQDVGDEVKWEIARDMAEFNEFLLNTKSEPLLKKLTEDRIEPLNEDGTIGAVSLTPAECRVIESHLHRYWDHEAGFDQAPNIQAFPLEQLLDYGLQKLNNPNQMDVLAHFAKAFKERKTVRELELILS